MSNTDLYKVGITRKNIQARKRSSQTGNPKRLDVIAFYETDIFFKIETILHRTYSSKKYIPEDFENLKGEWFMLEPSDVLDFKNQCKKIEENIKMLIEKSTYFNLEKHL